MVRGEASLNHPIINAASISSSKRSGSPGKNQGRQLNSFVNYLTNARASCAWAVCLFFERALLQFTISSHTFVSDLLIATFRRTLLHLACGRTMDKKRKIFYRTIILKRRHAAGFGDNVLTRGYCMYLFLQLPFVSRFFLLLFFFYSVTLCTAFSALSTWRYLISEISEVAFLWFLSLSLFVCLSVCLSASHPHLSLPPFLKRKGKETKISRQKAVNICRWSGIN